MYMPVPTEKSTFDNASDDDYPDGGGGYIRMY